MSVEFATTLKLQQILPKEDFEIMKKGFNAIIDDCFVVGYIIQEGNEKISDYYLVYSFLLNPIKKPFKLIKTIKRLMKQFLRWKPVLAVSNTDDKKAQKFNRLLYNNHIDNVNFNKGIVNLYSNDNIFLNKLFKQILLVEGQNE